MKINKMKKKRCIDVLSNMSHFQKMYWLQSVGPWVNQFTSTSNDIQPSRSEDRNVQGIFVNIRRQRYRTKKRKKMTKGNFKVQCTKRTDHAWRGKTLFICKLSYSTDEIVLQDLFKQFGKIRKLKLLKNSKSGRSRCYAFIEYEDQVSCDKAYRSSKETDLIINNVKVFVDHARCPGKAFHEI